MIILEIELYKCMSYDEHHTEEIKCSLCGKTKTLLIITIKRSKTKNNGKYICASCKAKKAIKPQCKKEFWTEEKRRQHGNVIRSSEKYYQALPCRKLFGQYNPMFGKKHKESTIKKMSLARIGKLGPNATAWKGGTRGISLTRRVKGIMHTRYGWYKKIYKRDHYKCTKCGSNTKLDAHHIVPVWKLIKQLLNGKQFQDENEKLAWLVEQPEIQDKELKNGATLCRPCHRLEHKNWGSHHV